MVIERADIQNIYQLTPLQEGMFFHAEASPRSEAYVEQWSLRISGELQPDVVRAAWNDLFARHEVFRSVFTPGDGKRPLQIVLRERFVELAVRDLSDLAPPELEARVAAERERDRARGFRLGSDPLVRLLLLRLAPEAWEIVWSHHHIILDGWSVALVQSEFMQLYAARCAGRDAALAPAVSFSRFVRSIPSTHDLAFWRAYLADRPAALELPRAAAVRVPETGRAFVALPSETSTRVEAFCRSERVTLGSFVQAVWSMLLARYADTDDVVFGWVVSGRPPDLPGVERMVGLFINTLPVRVRLHASESFRALLARVQRDAAELVERAQTPLIEIQRNCGAGALFEHVVAVETYPSEVPANGAADTGFEVRSATSFDRTHYGFELVVLPARDALRFRLSWDRSLHDDDLMQRLGAQLVHVIESVLAEPDAVATRLNVLPPRQWDAAVVEPNRTAAAYPLEATVGTLFDRRAAANPDAPALLVPHESERWLTYGELRERAVTLAAHLRDDLALAPGSRVAIFAGPSSGAIAAILGAALAGVTYVPVDPRYPAERVRFLLADARAAAIVTAGGEDLSSLPPGVPLVNVDALPVAHHGPFVPAGRPDDVAYVIYTSGSTGTPKGCQVTHRNVVRLIANDRPAFEPRPTDVWVLAHSLSFDFSVWEMFGALLHGARLIVPSRATVQNVPAFRDLIAQRHVTVLNQTPLAFANLVAVEEEAVEHTLGTHLRCVIFGGDRLDLGTLRPWIRRYPPETTALINMYGITETTVHVTAHRISAEEIAAPPRHSPLGRPLPETTVYVCDRHGNPQPLGVPGEMRVGGGGVCDGYLDRPELTAQRFVADDFAGAGRLYRSGDVAVRDAAGELFYVGRNDAQVKVRGHRIEPAEIERALLAIDGVDHAAVFADAGPNGTELVACVCGRAAGETLRAALAKALPEYALPHAFVPCATLPLTAHGKLDREAVRRLRAEAADAPASAFEAPATEPERVLAEVWAEVLGAPRIGRHDRFFSLGGDSIKSIQILARLRARGLTLELPDLFAHPTIAELAPCLRERRAAPAAPDTAVPFALTPIQLRFLEMHPVDRAHFNHALLLRCERPIEAPRLRGALQALVDAHGALRLRFAQQPDGTWMQRVAPAGEPVVFDVIDVSGERDPAAAIERRSGDVQRGLDLATGPLFRAALFRSGGNDTLLLVAHHLTVDGVSWQIVLDDLAAALSRVAPLPPTDAYGRWSAALREPQLAARLAMERRVWERFDVPPPDAWEPPFAAGTYGDARESLLEWSEPETDDIVRRACGAYQTNAGELVLAAVARALGRTTGSAHVQIALEGHGRDAVPGCDLSRTVGWCTALYPFVLDLADGETARRIRATKEDVRRVPGGGAGYGILRYLVPGRAPLVARPRVSFNYLGELRVAPAGGWFAVSPAPIAPSASPRGPRPFALEFAALVVDGRLRLSIVHPAGVEHVIHELRAAVAEELRVIVDHCLGRRVPELTPADLTHKRLSLDEFDGLFDED